MISSRAVFFLSAPSASVTNGSQKQRKAFSNEPRISILSKNLQPVLKARQQQQRRIRKTEEIMRFLILEEKESKRRGMSQPRAGGRQRPVVFRQVEE